MSVKNLEKIDNDSNYEYFSFFNCKLYDSPLFIQEEKLSNKFEYNNQSTEGSFSNEYNININSLNIEDKFIPLNLLDSSPTKESLPEKNESSIPQNLEKIDNKEIKPELHKYILPKSLFNSSKNSKKSNEKNNAKDLINDNNKVDNIINKLPGDSLAKHLNLLSEPFIPKSKIFSFIPIINNSLKNDKNKKREKKKNNNFVKRDGDWTCFKCKNLNFAFRKICNKCKLPKEESEKNFFDVGQELMKLANLSIGNKSKK